MLTLVHIDVYMNPNTEQDSDTFKPRPNNNLSLYSITYFVLINSF